MSPADYLRELSLPARSAAVGISLFALLLLLGLLAFVARLSAVGGVALALVLGLFVLPGLMRFLFQIAEDRARGRAIDPPTAEQFMLVSALWPLLPFVLGGVAFLVCAYLRERVGDAPAAVVAALFTALLPASIGVLAITHSASQSVNPLVLGRYIAATGTAYVYAVLTLAGFVLLFLPALGLGPTSRVILGAYCLAALFAVAGRVACDKKLLNEVDIPDAVEPAKEQQTAHVTAERTQVLNHVYGLASRGNRDGGLQFLLQQLGTDPDPQAGWAWYFAELLRWESRDAALHFAQHYLAWLLAHDEPVKAVKLMLRCKLENDAFRPFPHDLVAATDAARHCANHELTRALETGR